jgi:hypothetical protein
VQHQFNIKATRFLLSFQGFFLFLSTQFGSKSPLQLGNDLLIGNSFTRFILLDDLRLLINQLQMRNGCHEAGQNMERERERERERVVTCASWACVSFFSVRACVIAFFSSVGTRSSTLSQDVRWHISRNSLEYTWGDTFKYRTNGISQNQPKTLYLEETNAARVQAKCDFRKKKEDRDGYETQ